MSAVLRVLRAGPLATIQDDGRFGMLRHGVTASGPMDKSAYAAAGQGGRGGVEITQAGIDLTVESGSCRIGFAGGSFRNLINGVDHPWPGKADLSAGDTIRITPGASGNYGYLRFDTDIAVPPVLGSISTSTRVRLGGVEGRTIRPNDAIRLGVTGTNDPDPIMLHQPHEHIRIVWGLHADLFSSLVRQAFLTSPFVVSSAMDRMGVRLQDRVGVFSDANHLSLVSDAVVSGDIQILGDGTPIVLMRDHQPTGGYPRIATIITADFDRFAQMRPETAVTFASVTVEHAHHLLRSRPS